MNYTEKLNTLRRLAATREHTLDLRQLDGTRRLNDAQLDGMKRYLDRCPPVSVSRETQQPPAPAPAPAPEAPARGGFRPGERVTSEGMYYNRGRVFKVYRSQYGDRGLRVKVLDPAEVNPRTGRKGTWSAFPAAMGFLRSADEMTAADSIEFEKKWSLAICKRCGAPLENDESRELRIGPTCRSK